MHDILFAAILVLMFIGMVAGSAILLAVIIFICAALIVGLTVLHEFTVSFLKKNKLKIYRFLLKVPRQFSYIVADVKRPWKIYNREQRRRE